MIVICLGLAGWLLARVDDEPAEEGPGQAGRVYCCWACGCQGGGGHDVRGHDVRRICFMIQSRGTYGILSLGMHLELSDIDTHAALRWPISENA